MALTGESLPVDKKAGDEAYSGEMEPRHLVTAYHWTHALNKLTFGFSPRDSRVRGFSNPALNIGKVLLTIR